MFSATPIVRSAEVQNDIDHACQRLALYHFNSCPFCQRVRSRIQRLALPIELRDIQRDPRHRQDLMAGGGRTMVPCLRIEKENGAVEWMYESADINRYLERRFG
ncbi:glutathione S-transferase N-terminal domain-containing protein [Salinicola sp. CPA57]|uniref:glutaredoxin family protein n=1 Tax=Salinicola sp. CPA57 TaxID=1949080 RepID=UPI000DA172F1|nr:glutathione S-transferase N-terminal domain-containing protein [Salinicola sp. CPA57]